MENISFENLLHLVSDPSALLMPQNLIVAVAAVVLASVGLRLVFGMARFIFLVICLVLMGILSAGATYAFTQFLGDSGSLFQ